MSAAARGAAGRMAALAALPAAGPFPTAALAALLAAAPFPTAAAPAAAAPAAGAPASIGGLPAQDPAGTIVGLVYDSTAFVPLAEARVAVVGTSSIAVSDEQGRFRIDGVPAGERTLVFFHPRLGVLGVSAAPRTVAVGDRAVAEAYLAVPSRSTILAGWCSAEEGEGGTSIGGIVTDALTGVPLPRARVVASAPPSGLLQRRRPLREARTGTTGEFQLCNLPAPMEGSLLVATTFGSAEAPPFEVAGPGPHVRDVEIHISDPVTITGTVTDYATRSPIPNARVHLVGSPHADLTDSAGAFGFAGVPPGKQIIETSVLGYAPRIDSLTVFSNEALGLQIVLATEAIALDPIVVTGRRRERDFTTPGTRFSGLTEAQVDSILPRVMDFAGLARAARTPGVSIYETNLANVFGDPEMGVCVEMQRQRGGGANTCNMVDVRVNDVPLPDPAFFLRDLNPQDVASMQFITPLEAGLLYGNRGANGVLLIYTR